jgi:peptidyl-prolyl isomerase H (cyclophilin H)
MANPFVQEALERGNKVVFFDISIAERPMGRILMELYQKDCPITCDNFLSFCIGWADQRGLVSRPQGYKGCDFHRVVKGFVLQGGDFMKGDGSGSTSIYGSSFADENFLHKHDSPGLLSMANSGVNTNGSQFFITLSALPHLDGSHVVFGKILGEESVLLMRKIENVPTLAKDRPKLAVTISGCGEM